MLDVRFEMFFDRPGVERKVKDGTKSALSRFGAFVRTRAQRSIRPAPKKSYTPQPGLPPRGHVGTLRDLILFGYDTSTESVVIGPKLFRSKSTGVPGPHLLEFGGSTILGGKRANFRKFPFMQPALEAEAPKFAGLFSGCVKG